MAEDTQNLVQNEMPEESVVEVGNRGLRTMMCTKGNLVTALSVFVGLLIVGQAVTVYFVTQQQNKINDLDATATQIKLNDMIKNLRGSPPSQKLPKMRMATFNIPMLFKDTDETPQVLEKTAMDSNTMEDAAKYILLRGNPLRKYPSFNDTILENLRKLKKTLSDEEWMVFDSWMQQWYLFYLVQSQNTKTPQPTSPPEGPLYTGVSGLLTSQERVHPPASTSGNLVYASTSYSTDSLSSFNGETPSGVPVMTLCQQAASTRIFPGTFVPQCDEKGDFNTMQCWRSTGYCWCVYKNGTEIPETRTRAKLDCSDILELLGDMDERYYGPILDEKM